MMESYRRLLVLLAILCSAVAVPLSRKEKCARHCTESNRFQFIAGKTYTYEYETLTTTTVKGTSEETSQLQMKAQVDIEVLSKCDLSLRMRDVTLKQSDPQRPEYLSPVKGGHRFAKTAEKYILRFSYQDGVVEELCPDEEAPAWVTNIQRGILSAFQNSMSNMEGSERLVETDVAGKCSVEYQSLGRSWRGTLSIRKLKDLNACTDRHSADTSFQAAPFTHGSSIQSMPIVKAQQECEQSIGGDILQSSSCTESHVLRPFSKGSGGATTTVNQRLIYVSVGKKSFTGDDYRPTRETLLFDHEKEKETSGKSEEEAERALAKLCDASSREMTISVPGLFASFVYRMKQLDYNTFRSLYTRVETICPNNPKAKKFFLDAVPVISTLSSVKFMAEMVTRKEVSQSEMNFWFSSLSFVSEPTSEMIAALKPLLNGEHDQAFFGISSLVHTFCKKHDCSNIPEVRAVVHQLTDYLGEYCVNPDVKKILLTLKSIGNIGLPYGREKILERCAQNPQLETEVRISAIQAFRRFSCETSRDTFLKMYANYNEGSEMRIAAYLASIACPTPETLQSVKQTLEDEQVNQVGSFVWTHLRALAKSQHPDRQDIKDIFSNLYLLNKYESDIRKFSSAREASFYLEAIESGFHVDTHLIFPTHSYLPHSATFNLTMDIFGHSCNLLQLDGRLEGMEQTMEWFFGPNGIFPQKHVAKLLRDKRSVSENKIDRMDKEFDVKSKFDKKPYGSLDVKIFGNTMWYSQYQEDDLDTSSSSLMDLIAQLATKQEAEFSRSFMFLDTDFAIPMATGLPLRLSLNGTATVGLKLGGKFNVRSFQNVDVLANIEPSGAVELAGLLTVDAGGVTRTGLRIAATLHSSTVLDSSLEVRNGQLVKAQLNVPREKIEIIDIQSKLYLVYGTEEREQQGQRDKNYHYNSCAGVLSRRILGIEVCTDVSLPKGQRNAPMYPMSGAATFSLYLQKTDPALTAYTFDASWESKMVNGKEVRNAVVSLNTPKSTIDREVSLQFHLSEPDNSISLDLKTPIKKFGLKAKYANGKEHTKVDLSATVDDKDTFSVKAELRVAAEDGGISYFPNLEIQMPSRKLLSVAGSAHLRHGLKYGGQLTIKEITTRPIILKGSLDVKNKDRYESSVSISSFGIDTTTKASLQLGKVMFVKLNTDYSIMEGKQYKININGKIRDLSANALSKYTGVLSMQATAFPEWDTSISCESMKTTGHLENTLSMSIGDSGRSRVHTINIQEIVHYKGDLNDNSVEATLKFSYPEKGMNYGLEMKHANTDRTLRNEIGIQYAKNRMVSTVLNMNLHGKNTVDFSGDAELRYPGRKMKVSTELSEVNPRDYRSSLMVQWQEGKHVTMVSHYRDRGNDNTMKHEADAEITFSYRQPITFSSSIGSQRGQYAGFVELNLGLDKYKISADYTKGTGFSHRLSGQVLYGTELYVTNALLQHSGDKCTGSVEAKFPSRRRVIAKVNVKSGETTKTLEIESMWDADRDPTQRFALDSEIHTKNNGYEGSVTVQVRRRRIRYFLSTTTNGRLSGNYLNAHYKSELQWSAKEKITMALDATLQRRNNRHEMSSTLDLTTPYLGYETVNVNMKHGAGNQQWSTQASAKWGNNKLIDFSTDGKYASSRNGGTFETSVIFRSPFRKYESLSFNATHFQDSLELSNKMQLQWNRNDKITTDLYNSMTNSGFRSGGKLTTPFASFSDVSMEITHSYTSGSYKTNGVLQWSPTKRINAAVDVRHMASGRRRTCSLNFAASSPFRGYETVSSKLAYNNDGTTVNADVEVLYSKTKKITGGFMGSYQNNYYNRNLDAKVYFTSPFENVDNLQLTTTYKSTSESYEFNVDALAPNQKTLSFNSIGKLASWRNIELNVVLNGNLPVYEVQRLSFDLVHKLQNSNLRSTLVISQGRKQVTVILSGVSKPGYKSQDIESSLMVKTPFVGYEEIKMDAVHKQSEGDYMTRIECSKNKIRTLIVHNMNVKDLLNVESNFHLTSSFSSLSDLKVTLSQVYNPGYFTHATKMLWNRNNAIEVNAQYQSKISLDELALNLRTPFKALKSFAISAEQQSGHVDYKSKIIAQWNGKEVMAFDNSFTNYGFQQAEAEIRFMCNFERKIAHQFTGKYDITSPQKTMALTYHWNHGSSKVISLSGNALVNHQSPKFDVTLRTPFRGYERVNLIGNFENRPYRKHASLTYERNSLKVLTTAELQYSDTGAQYELSFRSPFKHAEHLTLYAKYHAGVNEISGDLEAEWAPQRKISFAGEASNRDSRTLAKITLNTPFENYESTSMDATIDITRRKNNANVVFRWGADRKLELSADCEVKRGKEGIFSIQFSSPFKTLKRLNANSQYRLSSEGFNADIEVNAGNKMSYKGQVNFNRGGSLNVEVFTPHRPFRNVVLSVSLINNVGHHEVKSYFKWEDKQIDVGLLYKNAGNRQMELKIDINTPFSNFQRFSVDGTFKNENVLGMEGNLKVASPFDALSQFELSTSFKSEPEVYDALVKVTTPSKMVTVTGQVSNSLSRPLIASISVDAPHTSFRSFAARATTDLKTKAELSLVRPDATHSIIISLKNDGNSFQVELKLQSPLLRTGSAKVTLKCDFNDPKRIQMDATAEVYGDIHKVDASYRRERNNHDIGITVISPMIAGETAEIKCTYTEHRQRLNMDAKLSLSGDTHQIKAAFDSDSQRYAATVAVDSYLLPFNSLKTNAKYVNGNDRDLELSFSIETPETKHTILTNLKNYEGEKFFQIKVDSPVLYSRKFSVTGTLKYEQLNAVDGVLTVSLPSNEMRLAANMKQRGWENIEGFLTLNTPLESLKMLRIDAGFKNNHFKNIELNVQVESSNRNYPSVALFAKLSRMDGSEDISLNFRIPNTRYHSVQVLGTLHYNPDRTMADARLTLSHSPKQYSVYGRYTLGESELAVDGEFEWNNQRWAAAGNADYQSNSKGVSLRFMLPDRKSYEAGCSVTCEGNKHNLALSYRSPYLDMIKMNTSLTFESTSNAGLTFNLESPFASFRNVDVLLRHQRAGGQMIFTHLESTVNSRKSFIKFFHRKNNTNSYLSNLKIGSPFKALRNLEIAISNNQGVDAILDINYDHNRVLKVARTKSGPLQTLRLEIPKKPLTITAKVRPRNGGYELSISSNCPTRRLSFNTAYHLQPGYVAHETSFTWDEAARRSLSYNAKLIDISKDQMVGKEFFCLISLPRRAFEIRGKVARSGRVQSGGIDFHWDAMRDLSKNMTFGIEHQDASTRAQTWHKLQMTLTHPALSKELVQKNEIVVKSTELRAKSELQYSRNNDHHFVAEVKANDLSRKGRDTNYNAEMSVRHLPSRLDVKLTGELTDNREEVFAHLKINSANRMGQQTLRELKAKILKLRKEIDVIMKSGSNNVSVFGKIIQRGNELDMTLDHKVNNQRGLQSNLRFNRQKKSLELDVTYGESKGLFLSASYPEDSASVKVAHSTPEGSVTDGFLYIGLEKSRILKSRVNWRPRMWRDLRIATGETIRAVSYTLSKEWRDTSQEWQLEWEDKWNAASRALTEQIAPLQESIRRDIQSLGEDLSVATDALAVMVRNNEFHIRDIMKGLEEAYRGFQYFCDTVTLVFETLNNVVMEFIDDFYDAMSVMIEDISEYVSQKYSDMKSSASRAWISVTRAVTRTWYVTCKATTQAIRRSFAAIGSIAEKMGYRLEEWVRSYAPSIIDMYYTIRISSDKIREKMKYTFNTVANYISSHPLYEALTEYWGQVVATIQAFQLSDLTTSVQSRVLFLGDQASAFINRLSDVQLLDIIRNRLPLDYVASAAKATLQKGVDLYGALGMDSLVNAMMGYAWEHFKDLALSSGHEMLHQFYLLRNGAKYDFDPKNGVFSFEYALPTASNSIYDVFNFAQYTEYQKIVEIKNALVARYYEDFCIWDLYYKIKNFFSPREWMPPFTAHAIIAGNQHFVTFDKLAFDFAGECSYLLARDFVDGKFTVIANYKREGPRALRKSLTILTDSMKVEVAHDYKVTLDDVKIELPVQLRSTVIIREGSTVRVENEIKGIAVICNFIHDVCTVGMSGFYFGKTGGLFGTYDYEPRLDFMTPEKNLATDVEHFANSWEVGQGSCRRTENMATVPGNDYRVQEKCRELFAKTSSNFRACFKQVDPEPFLKMCISDLSAVDDTRFDEVICVSAAAYFTECKIEGVKLKMPKSCIRCEREEGSPMTEGDVTNFRRDRQPRSADIVFIVEEKICNKENVKYLDKLAHSIEDNFRQQGFLDVRYRVVGFGGDNVHADPHIHTIDGREYGTARSVESAFQSLQIFNDGPSNMLEALRFAASLNYHAGSAKSFVLMKCSTCEADENRVAYGEVLRTLLDGEIALHLLMEQKYEMKIARNSKAKKVIGLDKNFAYTLKDIKDSTLLGDGDLLFQLKMPKDICVPLALEVNGSTFDSQYLTETKRNMNKKFMDVFSRRMTHSAKHRSDGSMCCECIATTEGVGKATCQRCVSTEVANMISADTFSFNVPQPQEFKKSSESKPKVRKPRERKSGSN